MSHKENLGRCKENYQHRCFIITAAFRKIFKKSILCSCVGHLRCRVALNIFVTGKLYVFWDWVWLCRCLTKYQASLHFCLIGCGNKFDHHVWFTWNQSNLWAALKNTDESSSKACISLTCHKTCELFIHTVRQRLIIIIIQFEYSWFTFRLRNFSWNVYMVKNKSNHIWFFSFL